MVDAALQADLGSDAVLPAPAPAAAPALAPAQGPVASDQFNAALALGFISMANRMSTMDSRAMARADKAETTAMEAREEALRLSRVSLEREAGIAAQLRSVEEAAEESERRLREEMARLREKNRIMEEWKRAQEDELPPPPPPEESESSSGIQEQRPFLDLFHLPMPLVATQEQEKPPTSVKDLSDGQLDADPYAYSEGELLELTPRGTHAIDEGEAEPPKPTPLWSSLGASGISLGEHGMFEQARGTRRDRYSQDGGVRGSLVMQVASGSDESHSQTASTSSGKASSIRLRKRYGRFGENTRVRLPTEKGSSSTTTTTSTSESTKAAAAEARVAMVGKRNRAAAALILRESEQRMQLAQSQDMARAEGQAGLEEQKGEAGEVSAALEPGEIPDLEDWAQDDSH
ncbi:unnamed protein product [Chrysoparadoxa australica]